MLFKVISETDRVLANGGVLMIIDFFSEKPVRNDYQHIRDIDAYAFKQNYEDIFTASKLYQLLDKRSMNHATRGYDLSSDYYNKYTLTTLRKDLTAGYNSIS
jgi:ubiquinone/menaquinone biosynthesis C-methylase UbiE